MPRVSGASSGRVSQCMSVLRTKGTRKRYFWIAGSCGHGFSRDPTIDIRYLGHSNHFVVLLFAASLLFNKTSLSLSKCKHHDRGRKMSSWMVYREENVLENRKIRCHIQHLHDASPLRLLQLQVQSQGLLRHVGWRKASRTHCHGASCWRRPQDRRKLSSSVSICYTWHWIFGRLFMLNNNNPHLLPSYCVIWRQLHRWKGGKPHVWYVFVTMAIVYFF
jgi:hypothetical protein